MASAVVRS